MTIISIENIKLPLTSLGPHIYAQNVIESVLISNYMLYFKSLLAVCLLCFLLLYFLSFFLSKQLDIFTFKWALILPGKEEYYSATKSRSDVMFCLQSYGTCLS